jgi:hypothetical protein
VVNSRIASEYGIEAEVGVKAQYGPIFAEGKSVKLRLILENRTKRMTCHAKVDWVRDDPATGECKVGLGQLSLSDDEFRVLLDNSTEKPYARLKFTEIRPLICRLLRTHRRASRRHQIRLAWPLCRHRMTRTSASTTVTAPTIMTSNRIKTRNRCRRETIARRLSKSAPPVG